MIIDCYHLVILVTCHCNHTTFFFKFSCILKNNVIVNYKKRLKKIRLYQNHDQITVWKLQNFSVTQILCEINLGESRSSKIAIFAISGALNFAHLVNFSLQKSEKIHKNQNSEPLNVGKSADFALKESSKLISRII